MPEISLFKLGAAASETRNIDVVSDFETLDHMAQAISCVPWAPGIFKDKVRANKNLERIDLLVLDIDEGCTLIKALEIFAPYKHIIGTSKSHGVDKGGVTCDRFRVILFLSNSATSDSEFKDAWFAAFNRWPFIDRACKDSARFFFPCKEIVSIYENGELFSEKYTLPDSAKDWSYKATGDKSLGIKQRATSSARLGKLSKATKDFLAEGAGNGEWHGRFFKAAMDFKEQGYDIETARLKLGAVTGELDATDEQQLMDVYENRAPKYGPRNIDVITDWPAMVSTRDGERLDRQHPDNLEHLIRKIGYDFKYNEMDTQVYSDGKKIGDDDLTTIWRESKRHGLLQGKDFIAGLLGLLASKNAYHPVKQFIEAAPWNGIDHIAQLYRTLAIDGDESYEAYLQKWLVGVVAKLYRPGSQNLVLTFVGAQGIGKSRWLGRLVPWERAFGEGAVDPNNKDHELRHLNYLIWHIPELDYTTGRRETGALKDYLTKDYVSVRPAFARYNREGRSMCSFAASVNTKEFLVDQTGNRRFMVVPLADINPDHDVNIQQVFAQARALFLEGFKWWLDKEEIRELADRNSQFEIVDVIAAFANTLEPGDDCLTTIEILALAGVMEPSMSEITRMGAALTRRGVAKVRAQVGGKRFWKYSIKNPKGSKDLKLPRSL